MESTTCSYLPLFQSWNQLTTESKNHSLPLKHTVYTDISRIIHFCIDLSNLEPQKKIFTARDPQALCPTKAIRFYSPCTTASLATQKHFESFCHCASRFIRPVYHKHQRHLVSRSLSNGALTTYRLLPHSYTLLFTHILLQSLLPFWFLYLSLPATLQKITYQIFGSIF